MRRALRLAMVESVLRRGLTGPGAPPRSLHRRRHLCARSPRGRGRFVAGGLAGGRRLARHLTGQGEGLWHRRAHEGARGELGGARHRGCFAGAVLLEGEP